MSTKLPQIVRSVQRGVRWLKEHAEDLADARDIAITISALVNAERNPHSNLVQRLVAGLIRKQATNGSWSDELWDTTWAAKALWDVGLRTADAPLQTALRFVEGTQDSITKTWYEEPFETMLVLDLIGTIAPEKVEAIPGRPLEWVASLQNAAGCIVGIRYTGMAASLFCLMRKLGFISDNHVENLALNYVRRDLDAKPIWTSAAWSNYYPLKSLVDSGINLDDPVVTRAVDWFIASQDNDGKWMQVSQVHDTAMAVIVLSCMLTTPLVDVSAPRTAVLNASKENGTIRVSFHGPGAGAITPAEKLKISNQVRTELSFNQQLIISAIGLVRDKDSPTTSQAVYKNSVSKELEKAGRYAYGHLVPARIQLLLESSPADHLRLDIDERLIDLPW